MNTLDTIAELLNGSPDDVLVACDMLEEMDLDLVANRIRMPWVNKLVWSTCLSEKRHVTTLDGSGDQWSNYLASIQKAEVS